MVVKAWQKLQQIKEAGKSAHQEAITKERKREKKQDQEYFKPHNMYTVAYTVSHNMYTVAYTVSHNMYSVACRQIEYKHPNR